MGTDAKSLRTEIICSMTFHCGKTEPVRRSQRHFSHR